MALLEGLSAGRGVKERFAELRLPPFSPRLPVWIAIGAGYYLLCFVILRRVLASTLATSLTGRIALVLMLAFMLANAAWGFLFFRCRNLRLSFWAFPPYGLLALLLGGVLLRLDRTAALVLLPYLLYLCYATWWGYRVWRLNDTSEGAA
jgi:tryptophan-rich sensory protein